MAFITTAHISNACVDFADCDDNANRHLLAPDNRFWQSASDLFILSNDRALLSGVRNHTKRCRTFRRRHIAQSAFKSNYDHRNYNYNHRIYRMDRTRLWQENQNLFAQRKNNGGNRHSFADLARYSQLFPHIMPNIRQLVTPTDGYFLIQIQFYSVRITRFLKPFYKASKHPSC